MLGPAAMPPPPPKGAVPAGIKSPAPYPPSIGRAEYPPADEGEARVGNTPTDVEGSGGKSLWRMPKSDAADGAAVWVAWDGPMPSATVRAAVAFVTPSTPAIGRGAPRSVRRCEAGGEATAEDAGGGRAPPRFGTRFANAESEDGCADIAWEATLCPDNKMVRGLEMKEARFSVSFTNCKRISGETVK